LSDCSVREVGGGGGERTSPKVNRANSGRDYSERGESAQTKNHRHRGKTQTGVGKVLGGNRCRNPPIKKKLMHSQKATREKETWAGKVPTEKKKKKKGLGTMGGTIGYGAVGLGIGQKAWHLRGKTGTW